MPRGWVSATSSPTWADRAAAELDESRARAEALPGRVAGLPGLATTIGVVATDVTLTKAQCQKAAGVGHDGLARALKPVHTLFDGDTIFALATGERPAPDPVELTLLMEAGADCVARAIVHALLAATVGRPLGRRRSRRCGRGPTPSRQHWVGRLGSHCPQPPPLDP